MLPGVCRLQDLEVFGRVKQFEFFPRRGGRLAHAALRELQESVALHKLMRKPQAIRLEWV